MKLDKNICLGGRLNNKEVLGIRFNGYNIYPYLPPGARLYVPYEFRDNGDITEVNTMVNTSHDDLSYMFYHCESLKTIHNIDKWDTSNVTTMQSMFYSCYDLTTLDLSNFDTSNVTNMRWMFSHCINFTTLDLSGFDTSNVTTMDSMFDSCFDLTSLDLSNFNTSNVTDMRSMFYCCWKLEILDLSNFDMSKVTSQQDTWFMFNGCSKLHTLRLDNCSYDTINKIINSLEFPTEAIEGVTRKIYVNPDNLGDLLPRPNWVFVNYETGEEIVID